MKQKADKIIERHDAPEHAKAGLEDVWGMKRVGIALNSGSARGSESFLAASGMSIGRGEKSAGDLPPG